MGSVWPTPKSMLDTLEDHSRHLEGALGWLVTSRSSLESSLTCEISLISQRCAYVVYHVR